MFEENKWLKEILGIAGVEGVLLAGHSGKVIGKVGLNFDQATSEKIIDRIIRIILVHLKLGRTLHEVEIIWPDYTLVILIKKDLILITYCSKEKALPLLRITLHVVMAHLLEDKKFIRQIKKELDQKTLQLVPEQLDAREIKIISKLQ